MLITTKKVDSMKRLYAQGRTYQSIADALGVSKGTVCYWLRKRRDECPNRLHGEEWWRSALSDMGGVPAAVVARKLGCDRGTVYKWRRRLGC